MAPSDSNTTKPFVFQPSGVWDGIDGNWSSFIIQVGTPEPQEFRILPSTVGQEVVVPLPEGCTSNDPTNCSTTRGVVEFQGQATGFLVNNSTTWQAAGLFTSTLEERLGYQVNALYGYDTVKLGSAEQSPVSKDSQVVAGIAAKDFYLGLFGLGLGTIDFGGNVTSNSTYLDSLRRNSSIPSLSYGYTAGASYWNSLGSLTLGGYDASRLKPSNASFSMNDSSVVAPLQSVLGQNTLNGTLALLSSIISVTIDSTLPYLWLPQDSCDTFAAAFGLIYDNSTGFYLSNETLREQLLRSTPIITFVFGNTRENTQSIALPYSAFDLQVTYPLYESPTYYFPIRRASNESQYTIGRTLLQEAYLIVDYDRQNFTIAKAVPSDSNTTETIVAIYPPSQDTASPKTPASQQLSTGAIVGIVIGAVVLCVLVGGSVFFRRRRRRQARLPPDAPPETNSGYRDEKAPGYGHAEVEGTQRFEMSAITKPPPELEGETVKWGKFGVQELHTPPIERQVELAADTGAHEMAGDHAIYELAGNVPER